ncbi:MAG: hypothetical protein COV48_13315, partial [Elusimicrobia bacterium CG11_big_fil_rev_8_21_14_0_20_64_6]
MPGHDEELLGSRARFIIVALAGAAVAMACVYAGLGFHDGFGDRDLHRVGRKFHRMLPWVLCLSLPGGALLRGFYANILKGKPSALGLLWSVVRGFVHFSMYGMVALFSFILAFVERALTDISFRLWRGEPPLSVDRTLTRWLAPTICFISFPFEFMGLKNEGDLELPELVSPRRLLRWLPAVLVVLMFWTGAISEDAGDRVD